MKPELRSKIIAYNKSVKEKGDKASDMDILIAEILKLPPGQLKKVLSEPVLEIFRKHGVDV
jgi:hypothetical protein